MYRNSDGEQNPKMCQEDTESHEKTTPKKETLGQMKMLLPKRDEAVLSKLNKKDKLIEAATDPLPLSADCQSPVFLAIIVASSPNAFKRRNAIRGTWANLHKRKDPDFLKVVFLIGNSKDENLNKMIKIEMKTFGDIVLGSFNEDYRNLTYKTRLGLKWAHFNCQANYILKTDDDVFINTYALTNWLQNQARMKFYSGWCNFNSPVVRDPNSKWNDIYPPVTQ